MTDVAVVGLGRLGTPLAAVLAAAGHTVVGVDPFNAKAVEALNRRCSPIQEPEVQRILDLLPNDALTASDGYAALADTSVSFIVVPTPSGPDGGFDASAVIDAATSVASATQPGHDIVVCSTVMPGTMGSFVRPVVGDHRLVYAPQFIALGSVVHDLRYPRMAIFGSDVWPPYDGDHAYRALQAVWHEAEGHAPVCTRMSFVETEIAKLAFNLFLTMKISYANAIGAACVDVGADASLVLSAIGADSRVGKEFLAPGGPFGGPCLPRDTYAAEKFLWDHHSSGQLARAARMVNDDLINRAVLFATARDPKRVAVLGLAYKLGTPHTDASFGAEVIRRLKAEDVEVVAHDPYQGSGHVRLAFGVDVEVSDVLANVLEGAEAVVIALPWGGYDIDYGDRVVIDPWCVRS